MVYRQSSNSLSRLFTLLLEPQKDSRQGSRQDGNQEFLLVFH